MLLFDRITTSTTTAAARQGLHRGRVRHQSDLWFFDCHFLGDP
jgi:3-hydroxymyristoyl/3-hydroxydecanoyl-(acyl carrier protein) dehydratase